MYSAKFIRVGDRLFTGAPDDMDTSHSDICRVDGVVVEMQTLKQQNPTEVDGGMYFVHNNEVIVSGSSWSLGIPVKVVAEEARDKTVTLFRQQSPGCEIFDSK